MKKEGCGYDMRTGDVGSSYLGERKRPKSNLLGILKLIPLVPGTNYYLPGAIKYVSPGHFYFFSLWFFIKPYWELENKNTL